MQMAATPITLTKIITDKKSVEDLYSQLDRTRRELERALQDLNARIAAVEQK